MEFRVGGLGFEKNTKGSFKRICRLPSGVLEYDSSIFLIKWYWALWLAVRFSTGLYEHQKGNRAGVTVSIRFRVLTVPGSGGRRIQGLGGKAMVLKQLEHLLVAHACPDARKSIVGNGANACHKE